VTGPAGAPRRSSLGVLWRAGALPFQVGRSLGILRSSQRSRCRGCWYWKETTLTSALGGRLSFGQEVGRITRTLVFRSGTADNAAVIERIFDH
jgi:hypothetical protein